MTPATRAALEAAVEAMIGLLDAVDGDPDQEPDGADHACEDEGFSLEGYR